MKTGIFREELPGEKKSIINLLMTGWLVVISILGYMAFYLTIQFTQMERVIAAMDPSAMSAEQMSMLIGRMSLTIDRLKDEVLWLAILGSAFSMVGGVYTYNLVVRPLRKLVAYAETGSADLPEIKSNNEIKQLMTLITTRMPPPA